VWLSYRSPRGFEARDCEENSTALIDGDPRMKSPVASFRLLLFFFSGFSFFFLFFPPPPTEFSPASFVCDEVIALDRGDCRDLAERSLIAATRDKWSKR
jgi:hypothetical protein